MYTNIYIYIHNMYAIYIYIHTHWLGKNEIPSLGMMVSPYISDRFGVYDPQYKSWMETISYCPG